MARGLKWNKRPGQKLRLSGWRPSAGAGCFPRASRPPFSRYPAFGPQRFFWAVAVVQWRTIHQNSYHQHAGQWNLSPASFESAASLPGASFSISRRVWKRSFSLLWFFAWVTAGGDRWLPVLERASYFPCIIKSGAVSKKKERNHRKTRRGLLPQSQSLVWSF